MTSVDLVIPSYQRPDQLATSLSFALRQTVPFHRIIVAARANDAATREVARSHDVACVVVHEPGVLGAMAAGLASSSADIVAFTDDDAELGATHCERLIALFDDDETVAGVGGPDALFDSDTPRPTSPTHKVGQLTCWGRLIGNHHRGTEVTREVVVLKGVNAAYRRDLLRLPDGLRGTGAQPHFEVALGTAIRARGYRLLYTSDLVVTHRPAPRRGDDDRLTPTRSALYDSAYNLERSIPRRLMTRRLIYVTCIGDRNVPGLARLLGAILRGEWSLWRRAQPSWRGTYDAWRERRRPLAYLGQ